MSGCPNCGGKGFLEYFVQREGKSCSSIQQCPLCDDIVAYSKEVQKRFAAPKNTPKEEENTSKPKLTIVKPLAKVLPFKKKSID